MSAWQRFRMNSYLEEKNPATNVADLTNARPVSSSATPRGSRFNSRRSETDSSLRIENVDLITAHSHPDLVPRMVARLRVGDGR